MFVQSDDYSVINPGQDIQSIYLYKKDKVNDTANSFYKTVNFTELLTKSFKEKFKNDYQKIRINGNNVFIVPVLKNELPEKIKVMFEHKVNQTNKVKIETCVNSKVDQNKIKQIYLMKHTVYSLRAIKEIKIDSTVEGVEELKNFGLREDVTALFRRFASLFINETLPPEDMENIKNEIKKIKMELFLLIDAIVFKSTFKKYSNLKINEASYAQALTAMEKDKRPFMTKDEKELTALEKIERKAVTEQKNSYEKEIKKIREEIKKIEGEPLQNQSKELRKDIYEKIEKKCKTTEFDKKLKGCPKTDFVFYQLD